MKAAPSTIDDYIAGAPAKVRRIMKKIRATVRKAVPEAEEKISYRIPAFTANGIVLFFAAFKDHIGIYPPVRGDVSLQRALARYRGPKGNLKLPLDEPIPYDLIARIAKARAAGNLSRSQPGKSAASLAADSKMVGVRSGRDHRFTGIWAVVVRGCVFVRSWDDQPAGWRAAFVDEPHGTLRVGEREVAVQARAVRGKRLLDEIDEAYRQKYSSAASRKWVRGLCGARRRATTMELVPRTRASK
jgi:uncharacterized protein YdhG (YjbR/CyaY superfamily)